jgi:integrase
MQHSPTRPSPHETRCQARRGKLKHLRPALRVAGITKPFRPFHDLRHTALTHEAAAGNPLTYIQHKAGHSQIQITERYIHAAQVQFAGAAARAERRMFRY